MTEPHHLAEEYAFGVLDEGDRALFEAHLDSGCQACRAEVAAIGGTLAALDQGGSAASLNPAVREQLLDLAAAPALPLDLGAYDWDEMFGGVKTHTVRTDPARNLVARLVWARPGARSPLHRHLGDEVILVLQGGIKDDRGSYGPGQICRSKAGSVHTVEALPGEDCVCYVLYYGGFEMLPPGD